MSETYDTWDEMRAHGWDPVPGDSIQGLLGALGAMGKPLSEQQDALREWFSSPASRPAPATLRSAVQMFLKVQA